uniref:Uncharacterized protein n=1 Tax=Trypanosoma congolense (strain IL3000) TaxID=1068625 RepID=G0UUX0_TRYCI|nr:conserved hypothetical protein [Trypanosoma congolense IL3000]
MLYRMVATNIPLHIGAEEFYEYVRSHTSGNMVANALLITTPVRNPHDRDFCFKNGDIPKANRVAGCLPMSTGAAVVDYTSKEAAVAAQNVDFLVDGAVVALSAVGAVTTTGPRKEEDEGRSAYKQLQRGVGVALGCEPPSDRKRPRARDDEGEHEIGLRLVGIPTRIYGNFLEMHGISPRKVMGVVREPADATSPSSANGKSLCRSPVDLFYDVASALRRREMDELLSLRRISDEEIVISVTPEAGKTLLEQASNGIGLRVVAASISEESSGEENLEGNENIVFTLTVHKLRPQILVDGENLQLVKKHEVLRSMARIMELTNARAAGFIDLYGNVLLPKC